MVTALVLFVLETAASLWGSISCCGVLRVLNCGDVLWPFREHIWGEGVVPVPALAVETAFSRAAPLGAREVKC